MDDLGQSEEQEYHPNGTSEPSDGGYLQVQNPQQVKDSRGNTEFGPGGNVSITLKEFMDNVSEIFIEQQLNQLSILHGADINVQTWRHKYLAVDCGDHPIMASTICPCQWQLSSLRLLLMGVL
jgi:hypothetical protein